LFVGLLTTSYAVPVVLVLTGALNAWTLLSLSTLPMAISAVRHVAGHLRAPRQLADIDRRLAGLYGAYGLALIAGVLTGGLLGQ
jgi:1,4-dihydroxy-2-naphthoate octaprenyltransferase